MEAEDWAGVQAVAPRCKGIDRGAGPAIYSAKTSDWFRSLPPMMDSILGTRSASFSSSLPEQVGTWLSTIIDW